MNTSRLFEEITRDGWAGIERLVEERAEETLHLDFKQKAHPATAQLESDDKKALAKALSALTNTAGGVVVIGVSTSKGGRDDPDRAQSVIPIADVQRFRFEVERHVFKLAEPPISGLEIEAIARPDALNEGVVVIHVPQSEGGPHRAAGAVSEVNDKYFMRTTTQSAPMPHALLAAQFGRRPLCALRLVVRWTGDKQTLQILLRNLGRGAARQPAIQFERHDDRLRWFEAYITHEGWRRLHSDDDGVIFGTSNEIVVYPGMELPALGVPLQRRGSSGMAEAEHAIALKGVMYALDTAPNPFQGGIGYRTGDERVLGGPPASGAKGDRS